MVRQVTATMRLEEAAIPSDADYRAQQILRRERAARPKDHPVLVVKRRVPVGVVSVT